jgi:hypothetical protein
VQRGVLGKCSPSLRTLGQHQKHTTKMGALLCPATPANAVRRPSEPCPRRLGSRIRVPTALGLGSVSPLVANHAKRAASGPESHGSKLSEKSGIRFPWARISESVFPGHVLRIPGLHSGAGECRKPLKICASFSEPRAPFSLRTWSHRCTLWNGTSRGSSFGGWCRHTAKLVR